MLWGLHTGGWMSGLTTDAEDSYRAQIELLARHDLHATSWRASRLMEMEPERREQIAGWAQEHDIHVGLGLGFDYFSEDEDEIEERTQRDIQAVHALKDMFRTPVCTTGIRRNYHHYSRDCPLPKQIEILSRTMAPLAEACAEEGCPLVVHKVAHYGRDLAELCERTPGLGILLDTANCFLIGEPPLMAARDCAPYTYASHFKDHYAFPKFNPLGLGVRGAVPGQGDCDLRQTFDILMEHAPEPDNMFMELEIDPVRDENDEPRDRQQVLEEAVAFIRSLEA